MAREESDITSVFPFTGYEDGALVTKDGDVSVLFRIRLPEVYTLSERQYASMHSQWCRAIGALPEGCIVHKQDSFFRSRYRCGGGNSELGRKYELHFNERDFMDHDCILAVTLCTDDRLRGESNFSTLCRRSIVPRDMNPDTVAAFLDSVENFRSVLSGDGLLRAERLTEEEIIGTATERGVLERYMCLGYEDEGCLLKDLDFSDGVRVGDRDVFFCTVPDAEMLPSVTADCSPVARFSTDASRMFLSFPAPLGIGCCCSHLYNQYVFIERGERTMRRFEALLRNMKSLSGYSRANRVNAELLESFLDKCRMTGERIVRAHFSMMAWTGSPEEERRVKSAMTSAAGAMGAAVHLDTQDAPLLYWAGIPGNAGDFPSEETFYTFTPQAVTMFAGETVYRDSRATFGIKLSDRDSGRPLMVDLSDLPMKTGETSNRNKFVLGPSGTGKSFFMNHLLRSYYDLGAHIVLIDIGDSYEGLCRMIRSQSAGRHGAYIDFCQAHPMSFNPFRDPTADDETVNNLKALLLSLWKKEHEKASMLEENFLGDMLGYYLRYIADGTGSFDKFYDHIRSYEGDMKEIAKNFLRVMRPYYKDGRYGSLMNEEGPMDMTENRFIVFEIDGIKDNPVLMTVTSIIIMELFIAKMKRLKGVRKVLVIEEAWRALATERMAVYIKYLYKTVRKHFGEAIIVTQEIDDVLSSPIVKESIINNSDCRILMDQSKYLNRFGELQAALGLSDKQKAEILSINRSRNPKRPFYREVWIGLGSSTSRVYSLEVSREEYFTYTTEETEKKLVLEMAETVGDYVRAVEIIAKESRK